VRAIIPSARARLLNLCRKRSSQRLKQRNSPAASLAIVRLFPGAACRIAYRSPRRNCSRVTNIGASRASGGARARSPRARRNAICLTRNVAAFLAEATSGSGNARVLYHIFMRINPPIKNNASHSRRDVARRNVAVLSATRTPRERNFRLTVCKTLSTFRPTSLSHGTTTVSLGNGLPSPPPPSSPHKGGKYEQPHSLSLSCFVNFHYANEVHRLISRDLHR